MRLLCSCLFLLHRRLLLTVTFMDLALARSGLNARSFYFFHCRFCRCRSTPCFAARLMPAVYHDKYSSRSAGLAHETSYWRHSLAVARNFIRLLHSILFQGLRSSGVDLFIESSAILHERNYSSIQDRSYRNNIAVVGISQGQNV